MSRYDGFPARARKDFADAEAFVRDGNLEWAKVIATGAIYALAYALRMTSRVDNSRTTR